MDEAGGKERQQQAEENLREDFCLEAFTKDQILQIIEGSQGEDEKAGAQQAPLNGEPLGGGQLAAVDLHASEEQQGQEGGQRQGGPGTDYHHAPSVVQSVSLEKEGSQSRRGCLYAGVGANVDLLYFFLYAPWVQRPLAARRK